MALGGPRVPIELGIECGVVALNEIPALGSTTFTITASEVVDHLGMLNVTDANSKCRNIYKSDPPFTSYSFHAISGGSSNGSVCDVSSPQYQASCFSQLIIRFSTFSVNKGDGQTWPGEDRNLDRHRRYSGCCSVPYIAPYIVQ